MPHVMVVKEIEVLTGLIQVSKEYKYWQKNCLVLFYLDSGGVLFLDCNFLV